MTKFFSLISGQQVHAAPGRKIIPAEEFAILTDASEVLELARKQAADFQEETAKEAEEIKAKAKEAGFQEGLTSLNKHIFALNEELETLRKEIQKNILPLALKAAKKIVGEELKLHPDRIVDIVLTSLKPVTQHRKIVIYVNKSDLAALEENKERLKKAFEHLESLSVQERSDIEPGGCMIETEAGIINAQLENQWRALESAFEAFMKK